MRKYSHSALKTYQRCPKKWALRYIDRLEPIERSPAMERGSNLHDLLEMFHTFDPKIAQALLDASDEDRDLMSRYGTKYPDDEWKVLHAEEDMEFKLGPYTVVFKADLIVEIAGEVWIVDHKTTKNIPDEWDAYNMTDFQHLLYIYGVQQLYPEYDVRGFIFNYIRTKPPSKPKLIKDGSRIAAINQIDTDYDTLEAFAKATDTLDEDVKAKLSVIKHAPDRYFQRHFLIAPAEAVANAAQDTLAVLNEISAKEAGRTASSTYPRHVLGGFAGGAKCSNCEFNPLCFAQMMGMNEEPVMLQYKEREKK